MKYPKQLLMLERQAFAILQAMPEFKEAHDLFADGSPELWAAIEQVEEKYGIASAV